MLLPAPDHTASRHSWNGQRAVPDTPGGRRLSATSFNTTSLNAQMWSAKTGIVSETSRKVLADEQVAKR